MIKFRAGELLGFGISEENVKRLKAGQPIKINLAEMGLSGEMLIFYKPTDEELVESMKPYIGKETVIKPLNEGDGNPQ